jgi:N-acyl-D-aspartate/D-glutamate deacylase
LPLAEKVRALRDPECRRRILAESPDDPHPFYTSLISDHEVLYVLGDPPNYNPPAEDAIAAQARAAGVDPMDLIYDSLLARDGHEILYRPLSNMEGNRFESSGRDLIPHPRTILGIGDGGAHYSTICDAAYPTYFLTYWVRDAPADRRVSITSAVRMLSRDTAAAMGLRDRGLVRAGYKADLNVIDLKRMRLHAPSPTYDLPAGGRRLRQSADGYRATMVSGQITIEDGKHTGKLPGRLIRGQRTGPIEHKVS